MVITFFRERKKQKYLVLMLISLVLVILFVIWFGFIREVPPSPLLIKAVGPRKIEINWQVLQDPKLDELEFYPEIASWEEEVGRENPFLPY